MLHGLAILAIDFYFVPHALRNHQAIDAVGRQVFHVAIKKTGAFSVEHSVSVANHTAHRGSRSGKRDSPYAFRAWTQMGTCVRRFRTLRASLRIRQLATPNSVPPTLPC